MVSSESQDGAAAPGERAEPQSLEGAFDELGTLVSPLGGLPSGGGEFGWYCEVDGCLTRDTGTSEYSDSGIISCSAHGQAVTLKYGSLEPPLDGD
ncbi:hypothetical protein AB0B60_26600 [Streptomyces lincolnensis]|uniref:hypothetical protein n=1 Tax=Streptomyces lincolnensis TaxID=1915 RepID=UPI00082CD820|nr:hypothetical protein [Streptomyces lincolnensis]